MDLGYLRSHPQHLSTFLTHQRIRETPVSGGSICVAQRLTLDDGSSVFAKSLTGAPAGFFAAEAAGLRWLGRAGAVPVPEVIAELPELLALEWIEPAEPTAATAERFGRELARLHLAGSESFGAPWPGFVGRLPLDNTEQSAGGGWPDWFADRRIRPFLRQSVDRGALSTADAAAVERVLSRLAGLGGTGEAPARIHGDLWSGNVVWAAERAWLVDPAAQGGHRETDLACLALFGGAPYLNRILAAYDEVAPLADGWQQRRPAHQLYLLLVHTAQFGAGYREPVMRAARELL